jgi:hypothetical protein
VGAWGRSCGPVECRTGRAEEWARGLEIPLPVEQWLHGLVCSASYSVHKSWCGEAFHELGVQSAEVLAIPGALPQPSVSPASQKSIWFTELMQSVAVSQSPSWIQSMQNF